MKLGDICEITSGGTPKRSESQFWDGGDIPWVKIGDIKQKHVTETEEFITEEGLAHSAAKLLEPGTLLFSIFASIGAVGILDINAATNQAIAGLKIINSAVERDYLYHWLKAQEAVSKNAGRGVAQNNINLTILRNMEVPILDKEKQRKIVEQFSLIERLIAFAKCDLKHLDKLIKSRFVEMFGDPAEPGIYPLAKLGDLYQVKSSKRIYSREQTKSGVSFYRLADIGSLVDGIPPRQELFISKERYEELKNNGMVPVPNDILVTARGTLGRCYIIKDEDEFYFQDGMITWLSQTQDSPLSAWLVELFANKAFVFDLSNNCSGTTVKYLSISDLADKRISVPPLELQQQFVDFVTQVDKSRFVCALASQRFTLAGVSFESGRHFHTWTPLRMIYVGG